LILQTIFTARISRIQVNENPSLKKDCYCSYIPNDVKPIGELNVWWFKKNDIDELLALENRKKLKILPRYICKNLLFEKIDIFCWKQKLYKEFFLDLEKTNLERLTAKKNDLACFGMTTEEIIESDPILISPEHMRFLVETNKNMPRWEIKRTDQFYQIMVAEIEDLYCAATVKVDGLFEYEGEDRYKMYLSIAKMIDFYKVSHNDMIEEIKKHLNKGIIIDLVRNISNEFIDEYVKLFQTQGFRYSEVVRLKEKYLYKFYTACKANFNIEKKKRKLTHNQLAKKQCRALAETFWSQDPNITIREMSEKQELRDACDNAYTDKQRYRWICELSPNRKPGRRPIKK